MGTVPNAVAGAGSNVDSSSSAVAELDPVESLPTEVPDSSTQDTPQPEGEVNESGQPKAGAEETAGQVREDGRLIPKWMRAMKEADPEGYKAAKATFFNLKERESVHPTVQAAREDHELVQSIGGREGLDRMREDNSFFHSAATQFAKGDPAFVKDLFEEDPIAAALHVPIMLDEFKTRDFEGYKSTIARIWENDFKRLNFAPALRDLAAAIQVGDKKSAAEIAQSLQSWHDSIVDVSRRAEDPRVKTLLAERNKRQETEQQSAQQEFIKGYQTDAINAVVSEGTKVFDSFFRGKNIDAEDKNDLLRESLAIANKAVLADKAFIEQRDKHLANKDAHSAMRLTKARYAQEMTEAVKRVARRYGLVSGQAKTNAQPTTQKPNTQGQPQPTQGFVAVNERPQPEQIDRHRTTPEMIISGRAILTNGRKVDWSKLKAKSA